MRLLLLFALLPASGYAQLSVNELIKEISFSEDTIESVFQYVANSIKYDTKFIEAPPEYHSYDEVLADVIRNKEGVCMHYAALFHALCEELGYKSYIVSGYTKFMNEAPGAVPHAWNAVKIDGSWFLFDPTWASGYVMDGKFQSFYEKTWYKLTPDEFIYSHVPFDPAFQFRVNAASHREIAENRYYSSTSIDYEKLLAEFDAAHDEKKLRISLQRISSAGSVNSLISNKTDYLNDQLMVHEHNRQVYAYSHGLELLKNAKTDYEVYISAKKRFFKEWTEEEVTAYLESFSHKFRQAYGQLLALNVGDDRLGRVVEANIHYTNELLATVEEEERFVDKYLKTWKPLRIFSFL